MFSAEMASLKRKQTLFSGVARKAKEIRRNSINLAFDNKTLQILIDDIEFCDGDLERVKHRPNSQLSKWRKKKQDFCRRRSNF